MTKDLREFISLAESKGLVMRIAQSVPLMDIPRIMLEAEKSGQIMVVEHPEGFDNAVVYNTVGSRELMALAFGCEKDEVTQEYLTAQNRQTKACTIDSPAPVQEIVLLGESADVSKLPLVVHAKKDGGRYISAGNCVVKDPDTGIQNVSINRMQLQGPRKLGFRINRTCHLRVSYEKQCAKGEPLEVAVVLGNHPMELLAAASSPRYEVDEYDFSSSLRGEPLRLVHCKTVDLDVPADAEIVIEGVILPGVLEEEGPFGEFKGCYAPIDMTNVFEVRAITMRKDALYQTFRASSKEDVNLLGFSREAAVLAALRATNSDIKAVCLGPSILNCAVSMKKRFDGEPKNVIMAAFGAYIWLKTCVVVDEDVDIYNGDELWWAIAARCRVDQDVMIISGALGLGKDDLQRHQSKMGIDATALMALRDASERTTIPLLDDKITYPI